MHLPTSNEQTVGYAVNAGRGTLQIIWTCLVTTAFCTWTVQRLQVVPWTGSSTVIFRKKALWMSLTILCPEYVTWVALDQWLRAREFRASSDLVSAGWTLQHAFYIDMGGLLVTSDASRKNIMTSEDGIVENGRTCTHTIRLTDLMTLLARKVVAVPHISLQELGERSKSDRFASTVTILQVIYFMVITLGRLGSGLPISILEVSALAFIFCAAFIEFFWWHKPLDLRSSTEVEVDVVERGAFVDALPMLHFYLPEQDLVEMINLKLFFQRFHGENDMRKRVMHAVWIGCIFNGIHIVAWNYSFPTGIEALLWRVASIGACGSVGTMWIASFIPNKRLSVMLSAISAAFYCICRLFIVVEAFCSFRAVPPGLYETPGWQNAFL